MTWTPWGMEGGRNGPGRRGGWRGGRGAPHRSGEGRGAPPSTACPPSPFPGRNLDSFTHR